MKLRYIAALLLLAAAAIALLTISTPQEQAEQAGNMAQSLSILELGRAGDYGYAYMFLNGSANITMLAYNSRPLKQVVILNDSDSPIDPAPFIRDLMPLEHYGFTVSVSDRKTLAKNMIFVVATGAIPSYVLDDIRYNATDAVIIYIGRPNLTLDSGIKQEDWYSKLDAQQKSRLVIYDARPDEFVDKGLSLQNAILENKWAATARSSSIISATQRTTHSLLMNDSRYLRLIASVGNKAGLVDSVELPAPSVSVDLSPKSVFPWEKTNIAFSLNWSNGTAELAIMKEGAQVYNKELGRIREANYFPERVQLTAPGDHIVMVSDYSGVIGGGVVHVKDLKVNYIGSGGVSYLFNVTVDGGPVNNEKVAVRLGNSTMEKTFYISDGILTVPAQLQQGPNKFNMQLLGTSREIEVEYYREGLADIYIKYGVPGLLIVIVVYFGARMSRRPVYVLRVGETAGEIRKDVGMPVATALSLIKSARKELGIGHSPITAHEFSVALKRFVTEGADVTEGNVEEILQRLVRKGYLESYKQHYQLKDEGDVKRNAMVRMIRDRLIQSGVAYRMRGRHFVTDRLEIGFFGDKFTKNAIAVIDDQHELSILFNNMDEKSLAALRIKMANGTFKFVNLEQLDEVL